MFTGIVEEIGTIVRVERKASSLKLIIGCKKILEDIHMGDSIAVNGVCLTVAGFTSQSFEADVMPETFKATALHTLSPRSKVNLERAMAANGRFGGHFVSGHVDGTGTIITKQHKENALYISIRVPDSFLPFLMDKGSIAIDGTSLTLFRIVEANITISLIPHTQKETVLAQKSIGEKVNIECDMLAKYVQRLIKQPEKQKSMMNVLADNGFI
ncbi:riboflavin synthase [Bacillus sp. FJAT-50079]|uniref:riboflavin synthase n=1 Tax=Bacillus sp. FJAT-50079 TaxID=2833577 RepID=UPI001BC9BA29|nr:riboflavin synthase [Bacillus sp. FJAT-50079]MBS4210726.1 riboflavin synthase [Bacillus sp. FJAT-50079]